MNNILKLEDYKIEVLNQVQNTLKKDYYIFNPRYKTDLKTIKNILNYLIKHDFRYYTKYCKVMIDKEFYSQISNPKDWYANINDCIDDFILTTSSEILNLIQNKYFNKVTLKYEYAV